MPQDTNRLTDIVVAGGVTTTRLQSDASVSNRITGMTGNGTTIRTYAYDGNGNIVTDTRPGEVFAFTYNVRNRPVSLTRNGAGYATSVYNALEQLVSRATSAAGGPAGTVHSIYDLDGHLVAEADGFTGTTLRDYIWLGDLPLGLAQGGSLYMVHADHLARPIILTHGSRASVWQAIWRPWGDAQSITGTLTLDMRFPGQLFQIEAGLHYNWHRHYDPVTGRYTQPDPLRFVDGSSLYAYAQNRPTLQTDEGGLMSQDDALRLCLLFPNSPVCAVAIGQVRSSTSIPRSCRVDGIVPSVPPISMARNFVCTASCNVQDILPGSNCPDRVTGGPVGGSSEERACRMAKRLATQSTSRGCYPRHCQCDCR